MKLVSTQVEAENNSILGMSEAEASLAMQAFFAQVSTASQAFLLGMAMDLAKEDPRPKQDKRPNSTSLQLVFG